MARESIAKRLEHIQEELLLDGVQHLDPDTMEELETVLDEVRSMGDNE